MCRLYPGDARRRAAGARKKRGPGHPPVADTPGPERAALLRELVPLDVYYRRARGEDCRPEDYRDRFPDLDPAQVSETPTGPDGTGTADSPTPPSAGTTPAALIDHARYRVLRLLGRGGMGAVYQAEHLLMERTVALKVINRSLTDNPAMVERFRREKPGKTGVRKTGVSSFLKTGKTGEEKPVSVHFMLTGRSRAYASQAAHILRWTLILSMTEPYHSPWPSPLTEENDGDPHCARASDRAARARGPLRRHFRSLHDPRRAHRRRHLLLDIMVMAICAVLGGANTWPEVATRAQRRQKWLRRFLSLPDGIPSHDTFERVFDRIDPAAFQACFRSWIAAACAALHLSHVAIDGKTLRRSGSARLGPLHVVSAWATAHHLALGEVTVAEGSNEITAIPRLLDLLDLSGALVTLDALGCQKEIAQKIRERGGDYALTVKDNQPHLREDIQACFHKACAKGGGDERLSEWRTLERGHGRTELRSYAVLRGPAGLRGQADWPDLGVVGRCTSLRTVQGETSAEVRYFIGSRRADAAACGPVWRGHWGIENGLHGQMDINFGEDASRTQRRRGAANFAVLRRIALSLLKQHPAKMSIACKRLAPAVDTEFLEETLRLGGNSEKP